MKPTTLILTAALTAGCYNSPAVYVPEVKEISNEETENVRVADLYKPEWGDHFVTSNSSTPEEGVKCTFSVYERREESDISALIATMHCVDVKKNFGEYKQAEYKDLNADGKPDQRCYQEGESYIGLLEMDGPKQCEPYFDSIEPTQPGELPEVSYPRSWDPQPETMDKLRSRCIDIAKEGSRTDFIDLSMIRGIGDHDEKGLPKVSLPTHW